MTDQFSSQTAYWTDVNSLVTSIERQEYFRLVRAREVCELLILQPPILTARDNLIPSVNGVNFDGRTQKFRYLWDNLQPCVHCNRAKSVADGVAHIIMSAEFEP